MLEACEEHTAKILEKPQEDLAAYTGEPDEYLSLDIEKFKTAFEQFLRRKKAGRDTGAPQKIRKAAVDPGA